MDATTKARHLLGKITKTEKTEDAYIFYNDEKKYDGVIVIMKKDGRIMSLTEYYMRNGGR